MLGELRNKSNQFQISLGSSKATTSILITQGSNVVANIHNIEKQGSSVATNYTYHNASRRSSESNNTYLEDQEFTQDIEY